MRLVIGGTAQGKLEYVCAKYDLQKSMVWEGVLPDRIGGMDSMEGMEKPVIINHLHQWIKSRILDGGNPEEEILTFLDFCDNCVILCDEIGNGIVPADPFERAYRERTGRILIQLAGRAESVERVICKIGQKMK